MGAGADRVKSAVEGFGTDGVALRSGTAGLVAGCGTTGVGAGSGTAGLEAGTGAAVAAGVGGGLLFLDAAGPV